MIAVVPVDGGVQQCFPQGFVWVVPAVNAMESAESRAQLVVLFQIGVCLLLLGGHKGEALVQTPGTLEPLPVAFFYHPHGCPLLSSCLILSSLSMIR